MKTCIGCKKSLLINCFSISKRESDGLQQFCKECRLEQSRHTREKWKIHWKTHERIIFDKLCSQCKEIKSSTLFYQCNSSPSGYSSRCRKCDTKSVLKSRAKRSPEDVAKCGKQWRDKNSEKIKIKRVIWRRSAEGKEYNSRSYKKYIKNNTYRINKRFSTAIYHTLKTLKGGRHWETLVGYSLNDLREHLEKQFKEGMSWDNYGAWHIDHIRPISSFNITDISCEDFINCWSLSNLQPLWAKDNLSKHDKYEPIVRNNSELNISINEI